MFLPFEPVVNGLCSQHANATPAWRSREVVFGDPTQEEADGKT